MPILAETRRNMQTKLEEIRREVMEVRQRLSLFRLPHMFCSEISAKYNLQRTQNRLININISTQANSKPGVGVAPGELSFPNHPSLLESFQILFERARV